MRKFGLHLLLTISVFVSFGTIAAQVEDSWSETRLRIHGSNTVGERFAPALAEKFLDAQGFPNIFTQRGESPVEQDIVAENPASRTRLIIELHAHGSSTGFKDLKNQTTEIAMSSRRIKEEEAIALSERFPSFSSGDAEHIIAYDALAIIVNSQNPIAALTIEEMAGIFSGEIDNWRQLGGTDSPIRVLARDDNSGTYDTFKSLVLKKWDKQLSESAERFESSKALSDLVADHVNAIGFVGVSHTGDNRIVSVAKEKGGQGIQPNQFTIGTEDYPLSRKLYMYLPSEINAPIAKQFIDFVESNEGQKLATEADLISFYPTLSRPRLNEAGLEKPYANLSMFGQRLSVMIRIDNGEFDSKAKRDLERVMSFHQQNPRRRLVLAGFWDDPAASASSREKAKQWMKKIELELKEKDISPWIVEGGFLPIENNEIETGKAINRRVEVWVL